MDIFTLARSPDPELISTIRRGVSARAFTDTARALNIPSSILAKKLHIRAGVVVRCQANRKPLSLEVSEKVLRIARIRNLAQSIFTSDAAIGDWLIQPSPALDRTPPLDWLDTETGARRVENLLHGLMHGTVM